MSYQMLSRYSTREISLPQRREAQALAWVTFIPAVTTGAALTHPMLNSSMYWWYSRLGLSNNFKTNRLECVRIVGGFFSELIEFLNYIHGSMVIFIGVRLTEWFGIVAGLLY